VTRRGRDRSSVGVEVSKAADKFVTEPAASCVMIGDHDNSQSTAVGVVGDAGGNAWIESVRAEKADGPESSLSGD
jgi:hypothetical protein